MPNNHFSIIVIKNISWVILVCVHDTSTTHTWVWMVLVLLMRVLTVLSTRGQYWYFNKRQFPFSVKQNFLFQGVEWRQVCPAQLLYNIMVYSLWLNLCKVDVLFHLNRYMD